MAEGAFIWIFAINAKKASFIVIVILSIEVVYLFLMLKVIYCYCFQIYVLESKLLKQTNLITMNSIKN